MTRRIAVLGSTGSIGRQTLDVIREFPDEFEVIALSAHSSIHLLTEQVDEFSPDTVCVSGSNSMDENIPDEWIHGSDGLDEIAGMDLDLLVLSVVGAAGLRPCLTALDNDTSVALANKETLVVAGDLVMQREQQSDGEIIPVDSEHSALFQSVRGESTQDVKNVTITASGGPFRTWSVEEIQNVSREQALDHPNWDMGPKITIDSATMMNKGLEVIEACHLLDLSPEQVNAVIHPQSMVHGFVEFCDHSLVAHCAEPDMKLPIQYALFHPERRDSIVEPISMDKSFSWEFEPIDVNRFPAFGLAQEALEKGGSYPAVLNASNEVAVSAFLDEKIKFPRISGLVEEALDEHDGETSSDLETLLDVDRWARSYVENRIERVATSV